MAEFEFLPLAKPIETKTVDDLESQQGSRFLPEIPQGDFSVNLPQELLDQVGTVNKSKQVSREKERQRLDKEANALLEANKEIRSAENQLQKTNSSLMLDFVGIFDEDYNREFQRGRIKKAQRSVETVQLENAIEAKKEELDLKDAAAPLEEYMQLIEFQKQKLSLTTAQANAIIQSNSAKVQMQKMLQGLVTKEQRDAVKKSGSYNDVITQQFIVEAENSERKAKNDFIAAELANSRDMLAYKTEKIKDGLRSLPITFKQALLDQAEADNKTLIQLPGTKLNVTAGEVRTSLAESKKADQKAMADIVKVNVDVARNDAGVSARMSKVQNISSNFINPVDVPGHMPSLDLRSLNMLNIDDKLLSEIDFNQVHPNIRPQFQQHLQSFANANAKRDRGESVTREDLNTIKVTGKNLDKVAAETEAQVIEATPKEARAAQKEWNINGRMATSDNAASMLVVNSLTLPNLGGDSALESALTIFRENLADTIVGSKRDYSKMDPEERSNLVFQTLLEQDFKGGARSRDLVIKAMNTKNKNGITPFAAWGNNKSVTTMKQAMEALAAKRPELKNFLTTLGKKTRYQNHQQIAIEIANLSFQSQLKNAALEDNFLGVELAAELDAIIAKEGPLWNQQLNPVRGSLMTLMFKGTPAKLVDDALTISVGTELANAWVLLKGTTEPPKNVFDDPTTPYVFGQQIREREARKEKTNPFGLDTNIPLIQQ